MQKGTIARLTDKGFGFITREGEDRDLFFHSSELQGVAYNDLSVGQEVEFEVYLTKNCGETHTKWSPVATVYYKL